MEGSTLFYSAEAHDKKQFAAKTHKPNTECRRIFATALSRQKFFYLSEQCKVVEEQQGRKY